MVMWPVMSVASVTACMRHWGLSKLLCSPSLHGACLISQQTVPWPASTCPYRVEVAAGDVGGDVDEHRQREAIGPGRQLRRRSAAQQRKEEDADELRGHCGAPQIQSAF